MHAQPSSFSSNNLTSDDHVLIRPRTTQSRPMTARPTTAASTSHEASYVVALLEGRGVSREVGLAALNKETGSCILVQVCPRVLVAQELTQNMLLDKDCWLPDICQDASSITLTPTLGCSSTGHLLIITGLCFCQFCFWGYYRKEGQRHPGGNDVAFSGLREGRVSLCSYRADREEVLEWCWRSVFSRISGHGSLVCIEFGYVGLEFVMQLCVEDDERPATILAASDKCAYSHLIASIACAISDDLDYRYYALSSACALFKYAESQMNVRFAPGSLRICYRAVQGTMMIDPDTVKNLELVKNIISRKSNHTLFGYVFSFSYWPCGWQT